MRLALPSIALVLLTGCVATTYDIYHAWAWRNPQTPGEWEEFRDAANRDLERHRADCARLRQGWPNARDSIADCTNREKNLLVRMGDAFIESHPDLDEKSKEFVRSGQINLSGSYDDVARLLQEARDAETSKQQQEERRVAEARAVDDAAVAAGKRLASDLRSRGAYSISTRRPRGYSIACRDVISLRAALEYERVGDQARLYEMINHFGYGFEPGIPCFVLPKGVLVVPLVQKSEYWQLQTGAWVPAADLIK